MLSGAGPKPEPELPVENALSEAVAKPPWRRIALFGLLVAALLGMAYWSPWRDYLGRVQAMSESIRSLGVLAPVVFMLGVAVLVSVGFPRLLLCVVAGMTLGFWSGLFWTQLGTLVGNYLLFLVARAGGGDWVRRYVAKRPRLSALIHEQGFKGVILARQLPVPGLFVNLGFGLCSIRHRHFLLGTVIGQLPEAIPCTLLGAGVVKESFVKSAGWIILAVALAIIAWLGLRAWLKGQQPSPVATTTPQKPGAS